MKYFVLLFTLTLYVVLISSFSFLLLPYYGEYWGLGFALLLLIFSFIFGDKFILGIMKAKALPRNSKMHSIFQNFSYQQELSDAALFISPKFKYNIFAVKQPFSNSFSIVVGEELENCLDARELKILAFGILESVHDGSTKINLLYTEILFLCYSIYILSERLFKGRLAILLIPMSYLFFPLKALENYFFQRNNSLKRSVFFENLTDIPSEDYEMVINILNEKSAFEGKMKLIDKLIYNLTFVNNKFDSFLDVVFNGSGKKYLK